MTIEGDNVLIDTLTTRTILIGAAWEFESQADDFTGRMENGEDGTYLVTNKTERDNWMNDSENFTEFMEQWIADGKPYEIETFELN
jgi:hypothetical protein